MQDLTVTLVQPDMVWEDKQANLDKYDHLLADEQGKADLVVLPEMFNTGFSMETEKLHETMEGPAMEWLYQKASQLDSVMMASLIIKENEHYYNRLVWMLPDGHYHTYDKKHLFTMAKEDQHFAPGSTQLQVELNGWKIRPIVCFDLRFPVWLRNTEEYDLMVVNANWPKRRGNHWTSLLHARAIENQAYSVGVNRVGKDGNDVYYSGDSMVVDPLGEPLLHLKHNEQVSRITLHYDEIKRVRRYMPFLKERDAFEFKQ